MADTASALLTEAFNALDGLHREGVTFRTLPINVSISRIRTPSVFNGMEVQLDAGSVALLPLSTSPMPRDGEVITDAQSATHTIRKVQRLSHCYRCECDVTEA